MSAVALCKNGIFACCDVLGFLQTYRCNLKFFCRIPEHHVGEISGDTATLGRERRRGRDAAEHGVLQQHGLIMRDESRYHRVMTHAANAWRCAVVLRHHSLIVKAQPLGLTSLYDIGTKFIIIYFMKTSSFVLFL